MAGGAAEAAGFGLSESGEGAWETEDSKHWKQRFSVFHGNFWMLLLDVFFFLKDRRMFFINEWFLRN